MQVNLKMINTIKTIIAFGLLTLPLIAQSEDSKTFYSYDSENEARVMIVPAPQTSHYYIHYKGFNHHFDNNTLLYKKVDNDSDDGFYYQLAGLSSVNIRNNLATTIINGTIYSYSTVFLSDNSKTKIIYSGSADIVKARNVISLYENRQQNVNSRVEAKKRIKESKKSYEKNCQTEIELDIDWPLFNDKKLKTAPAKLTSYLEALEKVCAIDQDYAEVVREIKTVTVTLSKDAQQQALSLQKETLSIGIATAQPNLPETSYQAIFKLFD